jgi:hypothetical protein
MDEEHLRRHPRMMYSHSVIPAQAGIQTSAPHAEGPVWIPAGAGMTPGIAKAQWLCDEVKAAPR